MNVLRDFQPRLYEILEITPRLMTKAQLSKELDSWFKKNNTKNYYNTGIIYINDDIISELSTLPLNTEYNSIGDGWWDFTTLVYKKWLRKV
jgi:hypothetical protein